MLGTLAKWLRIFGYDTIYVKDMDDDAIAKIAIKEDRILITRDKMLASRVKNSIYLENNGLKNQIKKLIRELNLKIDGKKLLTRCTVCNEKVVNVEKERIRGKVPEYVYKTHDEFYICPRCGRIYWIGTHFKNMMKFIEELKI